MVDQGSPECFSALVMTGRSIPYLSLCSSALCISIRCTTSTHVPRRFEYHPRAVSLRLKAPSWWEHRETRPTRGRPLYLLIKVRSPILSFRRINQHPHLRGRLLLGRHRMHYPMISVVRDTAVETSPESARAYSISSHRSIESSCNVYTAGHTIVLHAVTPFPAVMNTTFGREVAHSQCSFLVDS